MPTNLDQIPIALQQAKRWILWSWQDRGGKRIKKPFYLSGGEKHAKGYTEPEAWSTFEHLRRYVGRGVGLGFVFRDCHEREQIIGVDLDQCRNPETGELTPRAETIVRKLDSYTEVSPSGTGLRVFVFGKLPAGARSKDTREHHVEFFYRSGFTTVTGERLEHLPGQVENRQEAIESLYYDIFPEKLVAAEKLSKRAVTGNEAELARELVAALDANRADDYWQWLEIGMALKSVDAGLIDTWDTWSQQSANYAGREDIETKWESFGGQGITIGSLYYYARADGWEPSEGSVGRPAAAEVDTREASTRLYESSLIDDHPRIVYHCGDYWGWERGRYVQKAGREDIDLDLKRALADWYWKVSGGFCDSVIADYRAQVKLPSSLTAPAWLDGRTDWDAGDCVPLENGILHIPSRQIIDRTPAFFSHALIACQYDPNAERPKEWLSFLASLWGDLEDSDSYISLLQTWVGYCLTSDLRHQRMLLMVGPTRSGKGTIVRMLTRLLGGSGAVCATSLNSFGEPFGMAGLVGKSLAIFGDMRVGRDLDQGRAVQNLLGVIGEDEMYIDRKYREPRSIRLRAKLMGLCNELPTLRDESGALLARYLILETFRSFAGKEDINLEAKLERELPGILNWALDGWDQLQLQGGFIEPPGAAGRRAALRDAAAPLEAFLTECTALEAGSQVECKELYNVYVTYCEECGDRAMPIRIFGKQLKDLRPMVERVRSTTGGRGTPRPWLYDGLSIIADTSF